MCGHQYGQDGDGGERYFKAYVQFADYLTVHEVKAIFNDDEWRVFQAYGNSDEFIEEACTGPHKILGVLRFGCDQYQYDGEYTPPTDLGFDNQPDGTFTP